MYSGKQKHVKEDKKMGINSWYLTGNDRADSSYTDFTKCSHTEFANGSYTDFTGGTYTDLANNNFNKTARRSGVRSADGFKVTCGTRKKRTAGKVIICVAGALAIVLAAFLLKDVIVEACTNFINEEIFSNTDSKDQSLHLPKKSSEEAFRITAEKTSYSKKDPAYEVAQSIMVNLKCDNDVDTAREIVNWVHSNINYHIETSDMTFEEAAYQGFTRKTGDCYVYFACTKMLLDCAGIPNLMVERYPVYTNGHYWNLVQLNGEWYHCDSTVFKDHPDMYFMCTDDEIADSHHEFNFALYPERAQGHSYYEDSYYGDMYYDDSYYDDSYYEDPVNEYPDYGDSDEDFSDDDLYYEDSFDDDAYVVSVGDEIDFANAPFTDYEG